MFDAEGKDFAKLNGTIRFVPGTQLKSISIQINDDKEIESDEQLFVSISPAVQSLMPNGTLTTFVTIIDNDICELQTV